MIFLKQLKSLNFNSHGFRVDLQLNSKYLMNESMSINVAVIMDYILGNQSSDVDRIINKEINSIYSSFFLLKTQNFNLLFQWYQASLLPICDFML